MKKISFISEYRPYLSLYPVKDKVADSFIKTTIIDDNIELKVSYLIKNSGRAPAINISSPVFRVIGETPLSKDAKIEMAHLCFHHRIRPH